MTPIYDSLVRELGNPWRPVVGKMTPAQRRREGKRNKKLTSQVLDGIR